MTTGLGTTPRKALSKTQRLKLFEAHKGLCCICALPIIAGERWIDEHIRALALAGSNDLTNRGPAHVACAAVKTERDMQHITKAKRQKMAALGIKDTQAKKIESAGFPTSGRRKSHPIAALPPKPMFRERGVR